MSKQHHTKPAAKPAAAPVVEKNPQPATERDTPVLIPDSVDPATESPIVDAPTPTQPAPSTAGKRVKVQVVRSHPSFGYFVGDEAEISEADFKKYGTGSEAGEFFKKR